MQPIRIPIGRAILVPLLGATASLFLHEHTAQAADLLQAADSLTAAARSRSFDLRAAEAEASQRNAQSWTSLARWLPRIDLQMGQSRSLDNSIITSGVLGEQGSFFQPEEVDLSRWSLVATAPLYRRSVHLGVRQALAERSQASIRRDIVATQLDLNVRSLLAQLLVAEFEAMTADAAIESAKRSLAEAELRFQLGQKTRVDVLRAQANLTVLKSQRITAEDARHVARDRFLESTGLDEADLLAAGIYSRSAPDATMSLALASGIEGLESELSRLTSVAPKLLERLLGLQKGGSADEAGLQRRILEHSLTYSGLEAGERLARAGADALAAGEWPELTLQGSLNKQGPDWNEALAPEYRSYSVSLNLSIPVFSWGTLISSNIEASRAAEAASVRRERQSIELLDRTRSELTRLDGLRTALDARQLAVQQNEELVRLTFKSYQLGRSSILELLAAETEYTRARSELARGRSELASLAWRLGWELGYDLDGEEHGND